IGEGCERGQDSVGSDFEDRSQIRRATQLRSAVELPIHADRQLRRGNGAVGADKRSNRGIDASGRYPEYRTPASATAASRGPVKVAIGAEGQCCLMNEAFCVLK